MTQNCLQKATDLLSRGLAGMAIAAAMFSSVAAYTADAFEASEKAFDASPELRKRVAAGWTAREALAAMEKGLLTSSEYVDILIERIEAHPEINAFIHFDPESVRAAAANADALRADGVSLGPLHGLPILIKDSINTADSPTTAGTPALDGFVPAANAPVLQTLLDAGAIILGKSNLHELSIGFTTNNAFTGPTRNPYDFDRIPGGSSGGNAAALAANFVPVALGEDTGGSVRVPAALTGTIGFRPTTGRYTQEGVVPLARTFDTLGPMGRDVRDLALLDAVISGDAPELEPVSLADVRIGVPQAFFRELLDADVAFAFQQALHRLESRGATLVHADIPVVGEQQTVAQAYLPIAAFETPRDLSAYLQNQGTGVSLPLLVDMIASPDVAAVFAMAAATPVPEPIYLFVLNLVRPQVQASYLDYLETNDLDVVIYPTTPVSAPRIGQPSVMIEGQDSPVFDAFLRRSHFAPLVGAPTLTLPIGQADNDLPIGGMDVAGRPDDDRRVLAIGDAVSKVLPRIRPPKNIKPRPLLSTDRRKIETARGRRPGRMSPQSDRMWLPQRSAGKHPPSR